MRRLRAAAAARDVTPTELARDLLSRELAAHDAAQRLITVISAAEVDGVEPGPLIRSADESDERYAARAALFAELAAIADDER